MKSQKGFTLVELIGALIVIGFLVASAYALIVSGNEAKTTKVVVSDFMVLNRLINKIDGPGTYTLQNVPTPLMDSLMASDSNNTLTRDGSMYLADRFEVFGLASEGIGYVNHNSYAIGIRGFDNQQCVDVAKALWSVADWMGIYPTSANNSVQTGYNAKRDRDGESVTDVAGYCNESLRTVTLVIAKQLGD